MTNTNIVSPKKVLKNFFALSYGEFIGRIFGLIATAYLARVLGAEGFGKITFAFAIVSYFAYITVSWGFDKYGIREVAKKTEEVKSYVESIITIRILLSIAVSILLLAFLYLIPLPADTKKVTLIFGFTLFTVSLGLAWVFAGLEQMNTIALGTIARQLVFCVCVLLLIKGQGQILFAPMAHVGGEIIAVFIWTAFFVKQFGMYRLRLNFRFTKKVLSGSLPFGVSNVMNVVFQNLGIVMLGFIKGEQVVGWYGAANKIVLLLLTFGRFYHFSLFPGISRACEYSKRELMDIVDSSVRFAAILAIPLAFGGTVLAREIVTVIFGSGYHESVTTFCLLVWGVAIFLISGNYVNTLLALDKRKSVIKMLAWACVLFVFLNAVLIPGFSMVGAASAAVCTEGLVLLFSFVYVRKEGIKANFVRFLIKPLIAATLMAAILQLIQDLNLFIQVIVGATSYLLALILLRGISLKEILLILRRSSTSPLTAGIPSQR